MALKLLEIFLTFGAPNILQSDNGRKFLYAIIAELKECWAELNFVTGGAKAELYTQSARCKREPADPINFLVVIITECKRLYIVGCREGNLASKFTAADLQVISESLLSIDEVPDVASALRTAAPNATGS
ncbi:SCAN domain-containing protein 3 [Trichinella pseudospiralis]|nr:SCAN domain-containing protein 3 [Trichinella pseudospiralis]